MENGEAQWELAVPSKRGAEWALWDQAEAGRAAMGKSGPGRFATSALKLARAVSSVLSRIGQESPPSSNYIEQELMSCSELRLCKQDACHETRAGLLVVQDSSLRGSSHTRKAIPKEIR